jgi:hypothetical protein
MSALVFVSGATVPGFAFRRSVSIVSGMILVSRMIRMAGLRDFGRVLVCVGACGLRVVATASRHKSHRGDSRQQ